MQDDMEPAADAKAKGGRRAAKAGGAKAGKAKTKGEGKEAGGAKSGEVQIARMLVRAQWLQEWTTANPDGSQADRKAAWKDQRAARLEQNLKTARKVITSLQRQGVSMTVSAAAAAAAADGDDDVE